MDQANNPDRDPLELRNPMRRYTNRIMGGSPAAPVLVVGDLQLEGFCHNRLQAAALSLPGRDVPYVPRSISREQIESSRQSYINAILIQSRGVVVEAPCNACAHHCHPFIECRRLEGHWKGSCANCKWREKARTCSLSVYDDAPNAAAAQPAATAATVAPAAAGAAANPVAGATNPAAATVVPTPPVVLAENAGTVEEVGSEARSDAT